MTLAAWLYLVVAMLGCVAVGMLLAFSWMRTADKSALDALADRPRLLARLRDSEHERGRLDRLQQQFMLWRAELMDANKKLHESNQALRNKLGQTAWAIHAWGPSGSEKGRA